MKKLILIAIVLLLALSVFSLSACNKPIDREGIYGVIADAITASLASPTYFYEEKTANETGDFSVGMTNSVEVLYGKTALGEDITSELYAHVKSMRGKDTTLYEAYCGKNGSGEALFEKTTGSTWATTQMTTAGFVYELGGKNWSLESALAELSYVISQKPDWAEFKEKNAGTARLELVETTFAIKRTDAFTKFCTDFRESYGFPSSFEGATGVTLEIAYGRVQKITCNKKLPIPGLGDSFSTDTAIYELSIVYAGPGLGLKNTVNGIKSSDTLPATALLLPKRTR